MRETSATMATAIRANGLSIPGMLWARIRSTRAAKKTIPHTLRIMVVSDLAPYVQIKPTMARAAPLQSEIGHR